MDQGDNHEPHPAALHIVLFPGHTRVRGKKRASRKYAKSHEFV